MAPRQVVSTKMSLVPKKALSNLSNLVAHNKQVAAPPGKQAFKRTLESSPSQISNLKKKTAQKKDQENLCVAKPAAGKNEKSDPTRTIESKIKKIAIADDKAPAAATTTAVRARRTLVRAVKTAAAAGNQKAQDQKAQSLVSDNDKWKDFYEAPPLLPPNVEDYDKSQLAYIESEPLYAYDIFQYYKQKEQQTRSEKYMHRQKELSDKMRTVLVDWLVEVQQTFELNHETLYLAVKFVDHFLMCSTISRARFQLLGLTAVFVACKLDERVYPVIDDFIYISDDAYSRDDFIKMEIELLKVLKFNLNVPLSYSFLRRYARCASLSIETLTLARYILESSLMDYSLIEELDSKVAAASLLLALKMKKMQWTETLAFYSGYSEDDLLPLMGKLNKLIAAPSKYTTIKNKYADKVFFEVSKMKPLATTD